MRGLDESILFALPWIICVTGGLVTLPGLDCWIGLYRGGLGWEWANDRCATPNGPDWNAGQPDARLGYESCAFITGSSGRWVDYSCHTPEFRCLCELGSEAPPAYWERMRALQRSADEEAKVQRIWAAAFVGAVIGIPVLLDKRLFQFPHRRVLSEAPSAWLPWSSTAMRAAMLHAGWIMLFCGMAPFFADCLGAWSAIQWVSWTQFCPMFAWGCALLVEFSPPRQIKNIMYMLMITTTSLALGSARNVIGRLIGLDLHHTPRIGVFICWLGCALVNGFCAASGRYYWWCRASTRQVYELCHFNINLAAGLSSALFLLGYVLPAAVFEPEFAVQYRHSLGVVTTSVSWLVLVLLNKPRNRIRFLGPWAGLEGELKTHGLINPN